MPAPAGPPTDTANVEVSMVLIGGITFVMATMYMLDHADSDVRAYSWKIMFMTITVFVGALLVISFNQFVTFFILGPIGEESIFKVNLVLLGCIVLWKFVMELTVALVSGAIGTRKVDIQVVKVDVKCCSSFLRLLIGFSNLHFWGSVQGMMANKGLGWCLSIIPLALVCLALWDKVADFIRLKVASADHVVDMMEQEWIHEAKGVENAAMGLVLAHLSVQCMRMAITGELPMSLGQDNPGQVILAKYCYILLGCGLALALFLPLLGLLPASRVKKWLKAGCATSFAFCLLYSMFWAAKIWEFKGVTSSMLSAFIITLGSYSVIIFIDFLADSELTPEWVEKEIRLYVHPLSVLIGFSWKGCFGAAISTITAKYGEYFSPPFESLLIAIGVAVVVIPAWRRYIVPTVVKNEYQMMWAQKSNVRVTSWHHDQPAKVRMRDWNNMSSALPKTLLSSS